MDFASSLARVSSRGKILRIILAAEATVVWSTDGWARTNRLDSVHESKLNLWFADFPTADWPDGSSAYVYLLLETRSALGASELAVILLDIVMPKIDGGELATQIEADRELHDTPIIFLTALVTHSEAKSGLHIQGHPLVAKPISIPELIDAIEKHLPVRAEC